MTMARFLLVAATASAQVSCGGSAQPPASNTSGTGLQEGAAWPMFRHDRGHSGASPVEGPRAPRVLWRFIPAVGETLSSYCPPVIAADGTIYVQSSTELIALTSEGTSKWSVRVSGRCQGSPLIAADGTIYVPRSFLHAIAPDGAVRWTFAPISDEIGGSPAIAGDGTLYVTTESSGFHALGPDGSVRWTWAITDADSSPAVGSDGTLYVASRNALRALGPSGETKWQAPIAESQRVVPMLDPKGGVYALGNRELIALSPLGAPVWSLADDELQANLPPALGADGSLRVLTRFALRMLGSDGAEQRRWEGTTNLQTPIVDARGTTFFAGPGCKPQAIDSEGQLAWSLEVSPETLECGSPIMDARGRLYFTSGSGGIIALGDAE